MVSSERFRRLLEQFDGMIVLAGLKVQISQHVGKAGHLFGQSLKSSVLDFDGFVEFPSLVVSPCQRIVGTIFFRRFLDHVGE